MGLCQNNLLVGSPSEDEDEEDEPMDHESSEQEFFEAVAKSFLRSTAKRLEDNRNKKVPAFIKY